MDEHPIVPTQVLSANTHSHKPVCRATAIPKARSISPCRNWAACVLLTFYLKLSYRDMEEWLLATGQVCQVLQLPRVPDHSTLARTFRKLKQADLTAMRQRLLEQLKPEEEAIAVDTTDFRLQHASAY